MSAVIVDLSSVSGPVYSGRNRGELLRERFQLDSQEDKADVIEVVIPGGTYTVSSSFFLGLFGPSVRTCGTVGGFEQKFRFKAPEFLLPILHAHAALALQNRQLFS